MTKFFFKFNKILYFWPISGLFPNFGAKKCYPKKSDYVTHNFIRISSTNKTTEQPKTPSKNFKENNQKDGRTEERTDPIS